MSNQADTAVSYKAEANEGNGTQDGGGAACGGRCLRRAFARLDVWGRIPPSSPPGNNVTK